MAAAPVTLERPVVVIGGYRSWSSLAAGLRGRLLTLTGAESKDILAASHTLRGTFAGSLRVVRRQIEAWRSDVADGSVEIDLVGISMGGLLSRALAGGVLDGPSLSACRIFTLASPHRGARLAETIRPDPAAGDMRAGSAVLAKLDAAWPDRRYELIPYAVLNDAWVGATRASPPGLDPIWTPGARVMSHFSVSVAPGIQADLARRLRGEDPIAGPASRPPRD